MKHWNTLTGTLTLLCGTALVSGALAADHPRSPGINARQHAQQQRIHQQKHDGGARPGAPLPPHRPLDPGVNGRQHLQQGRVAQGVRSGQLTPEEAARLRQEQKAIRAEERAYKSDGKLTVAERKDLHHDQNQASKDIYQEKHDAETRAPAVPPSPAPVPKK